MRLELVHADLSAAEHGVLEYIGVHGLSILDDTFCADYSRRNKPSLNGV